MKKLWILFALVFSLSTILFSQWHWQNPTPIGKPINDIQFVDSLNGYVYGSGGLFLKTSDAGFHWQEIQIPTEESVIKMFFINKNIGWFLTYNNRSLFKTTNAGINWSFINNLPSYAGPIWFLNDTIGYAGSYSDLLKTTDGGFTWNTDLNVSNCYSIYFVNQNVGFATTHNGILKTTNGGNSWSFKGIQSFDYLPSKIFAYDANNIHVIGVGSWINGEVFYLYYNSTNGGNSWSGKEFNHQLTDVYFESPTNGWVCSEKIQYTTNSGNDWNETDIYASQFEFNGSNSWCAGVNTISYSNDNWQSVIPQINSTFPGFLWDGCAKDTITAFACGSNKTILGTTDGGRIWNKYYSSLDNYHLNGITLKEDEIWAVGDYGTVISSVDNGITWNESSIIDGNWLSDITFISNGVGYIVGKYAGGGIFTSLDEGETWDVLEYYPELWSIDKIKFSRDDLGWATGYPYAILKSTTNGRSWEVVIDSIYGAGNIAVSGDTAWITYSNKVLRTIDAGINWESFKVFEYEGVSFSGCDIDFVNSKIGYVSAYDSRVFKSIDGGETWLPENYPKGLNNFGMDFVNGEVGWVFGYPGTVLKRDPYFVSIDEPEYIKLFPTEFALFQNYPNPFNPSTKISWQAPIGSWQTLKVYDILGNEIVTLVNEYRNAGSYEIVLNASKLSSGVYFYQLSATGGAGNFVETKKMMIIK